MNELTTMAMNRLQADYPLPRHNLILLSCMDMRLMNELTAFMDRDNLTNRYDHLVVAGAGLGLVHGKTDKKYKSWWKGFRLQVEAAIALGHKPEDLYIVEHRSCGAYKLLLGKDFGDDPTAQVEERRLHQEYAQKCAKRIQAYCKSAPPINNEPFPHFKITTFLMDLRGDLEHLDTFRP